jgi:hypothetical protein
MLKGDLIFLLFKIHPLRSPFTTSTADFLIVSAIIKLIDAIISWNPWIELDLAYIGRS